jgi:hypothetical protein
VKLDREHPDEEDLASMSTSSEGSTVAAEHRAGSRGLAAWSALGGVVFVVLFIVGLYLMFHGTPQGDDPPDKFVSYFGDSGHRNTINFGWMFASLGLLAFLFFVASLRQTVSRLDDGVLLTLTTLGGGIYVALGLAGVALDTAVRTMSDDTYQHTVYPELIHAADDAGYVLHATGGGALGVMILAVSIAFIRSGVVPKWIGWVGIVVALAAFATIMFLTSFVWMLWVLIVSIVLFWKGAGGNSSPASAA